MADRRWWRSRGGRRYTTLRPTFAVCEEDWDLMERIAKEQGNADPAQVLQDYVNNFSEYLAEQVKGLETR